jgi:2-oxoglutarate dehydrogenase E2 component (dihydrolipoamide succinyltransferase)
MAIEVKVPAVGESVTEVTLASWLKKDGDRVKMDEPLCSIESDKATLEVAAPQAGVLKILIQEGETVKIGHVIASVDPAGATQSASTSTPSVPTSTASASTAATASLASPQTQNAKPYPSPAAHKILAEKGIPAESVSGTGKDGRITHADALAASATPVAQMVKETFAQTVTSQPATSASQAREVRREKMTNLRKTIAKRLVEAKNSTAMLTTFNEVDMFQVMELRKRYKDAFKEKHGVGLGFMSFFTKACCLALKAYPGVNAQIEGQDLLYHSYADVGVAVSTPKGLVVPVLRNAHSLSLAQIESGILDLAGKARDGKLTLEQMQGGTFTITNGGVFGSMLSTPIINIPQSAILGMHNIVERPVVVKGEIVIRPIMYVALSYDHRIIDGRESVSFLKMVKELIEDPSRMLLDL